MNRYGPPGTKTASLASGAEAEAAWSKAALRVTFRRGKVVEIESMLADSATTVPDVGSTREQVDAVLGAPESVSHDLVFYKEQWLTYFFSGGKVSIVTLSQTRHEFYVALEKFKSLPGYQLVLKESSCSISRAKRTGAVIGHASDEGPLVKERPRVTSPIFASGLSFGVSRASLKAPTR